MLGKPANPGGVTRALRSVPVALTVGVALAVAALAVVLSGSPPTVAGTNSVAAERANGVAGGTGGCQESGTMPSGTTAIRLSLGADVGPSVTVKVLSGG